MAVRLHGQSNNRPLQNAREEYPIQCQAVSEVESYKALVKSFNTSTL